MAKKWFGSADVEISDTGVLAVAPRGQVLDCWTAVLDDTAGGKTLAELKTASKGVASELETSLRELMVTLHDTTDDVRYAMGTAGAGTCKLAAPGEVWPISKTQADTLKWFCAAGATVTIKELG